MLRKKRVYQFLIAMAVTLCCVATATLSQAYNVTTTSNQPNFTIASSSPNTETSFHNSNEPSRFKVDSLQQKSNCSAKAGAVDVEALGLASLYAQKGQNTKAIETLEKSVNSGNQSAEIYFALAELYENTGSTQQAKERYTKALELAESRKDLQVVVAAKAGLGKIENMLGNTEKANRWHEEAMDELQALSKGEQKVEVEQGVDALVKGEQQFLFLAARGCGECAGPGYRYLRFCVPC